MKRLNGVVEEEEYLDDDVPDADSLESLLQRDVGWTHDTNVVDPVVASAQGNLKTEFTRVHHIVPTTMENVLHLSAVTMDSRDELQND